jgi:hypothetical protein
MRHRVISLAFAIAACQPIGPQSNVGPLDSADADTDADTDTDIDTDTDTDLVGCAAIDETGPWEGHPIDAAGASMTHDRYTFDAGLGQVIAAAEAATSGNVTVDFPVSGAIVLARGYVPGGATSADLWLADTNGALYAYNVELGFDAATIEPGDAVSMQVTRVQNFFGTPEITGATGVTVDGKGNDVWVVNGMSGAQVSYEVLGDHVVEIYGELVSGPENSNFELEYPGGIITFRTFSAYDQVGDCIHWIGPVTQFSGVTQLNADDYDWYRSY